MSDKQDFYGSNRRRSIQAYKDAVAAAKPVTSALGGLLNLRSQAEIVETALEADPIVKGLAVFIYWARENATPPPKAENAKISEMAEALEITEIKKEKFAKGLSQKLLPPKVSSTVKNRDRRRKQKPVIISSASPDIHGRQKVKRRKLAPKIIRGLASFFMWAALTYDGVKSGNEKIANFPEAAHG